ncbi:MAG: hypothetical protein WA728_13030, partial [Xanthobacteraceae bacterium]
MTEGEPTKVLEAELLLASVRVVLSIAITQLPHGMTERDPTKVPDAEVPLAPSAMRNEIAHRIEKIDGTNGKGLADAKELSVP